MTIIPNVERLLRSTGAVIKDEAQNATRSTNTEIEFDVFSLFRPNECDLSRILGMLLDPHGNHHQKELFLRAFVELVQRQSAPVPSLEWFDVSKWRGYELESPTVAGRRLDVVLQFGGGLVGIENKPWASDQNAQLSDYADHLESASPGRWLLVYLCNWEPSQATLLPDRMRQFRAEGRLVQISFRLLAAWINECTAACSSPRVRSFLSDFAKYVNKEINGENMHSFDERIAELASSPENLEVAFAIAGAVNHLRRKWLSQLRTDLENLARLQHWRLDWSMNAWESKGSYFSVSTPVKGKVRTLCFEWEPGLRHLSWGLYGESSTAQDDYDRLLNTFPGIAKTDRSWPWWQDGSSGLQPLGMPEDWSSSAEAWTFIKNGDFAREIINLSKLAFESLEDKDD